MNFIIFDLEYNQSLKSRKEEMIENSSKIPFEIIQIGAVKLDGDFNTISTFSKFIKPEIYSELHPFVKKLTGITIDELNTAMNFSQVYNEFIKFINNNRNVLCVWGMSDMKELFRNADYHKLDTEQLPRDYINIQFYASKYLNCPKGTNIGLSNAVDLLHIPIKNEFHNAFCDASYTATVFKIIYSEKVQIRTYYPNKHLKRIRQDDRKTKVDTLHVFYFPKLKF
ncbi:3'-5' exonuclease [Clostridium sediminicola]|uniref:exonuclease domain-containing protein n=1 Tax=Clostridium sediminicola TaxID=3114879 RepID=UPI0031F1F050